MKRPPNLLFLLTDEQRSDTLAAYGNSRIECPNLDALARRSTVFDRAYVAQPVCTPSRASLMTGLYPHQHRCIENNTLLDPRLPTWAECLPAGVYATGYNGKWHLGDEVFAQRGFEEWVSTEDGYSAFFSPGRDRSRRTSYDAFLREHGRSPAHGEAFSRAEAARMEEALGKPAFQAEKACEFIHKHRAHPFALCVSFLEPHMPFFGPRDALHPPDEVALPGNFHHVSEAGAPLRTRLNRAATFARGHSGYPLQTEADWRQMIARYWGLCSVVDSAVGRILGALEAAGVEDETIIIFTSDHGDMMGSHRMIAKCVMYEEAVRVPLMVRLPGQRGGARVARPVSHLDLVATLSSLLGEEGMGSLPGTSLETDLSGQATATPGPVVVEWNGTSNGLLKAHHRENTPAWAQEVAPIETALAALNDPVRTWVDPSGWKLTRSTVGEDELYHLPTDPGETANLARTDAGRATFARLDTALKHWQERTNDSVVFS